MSKSRFLSNTFIVAMIRQLAGTRMTSVFSGRIDAGGHQRDGVLAALALEGQHHGRAGEHREELTERPVEVRSVELVDDEPAARLDGVDEQAGPVDQAVGRGLEAADGLEGRPLAGGRGGQVAGAEHRLAGDVGGHVGERGLAGAGWAREDHVLAGVDGGDELVEDVVGEQHPRLVGGSLQFCGGEGTHGPLVLGCSALPVERRMRKEHLAPSLVEQLGETTVGAVTHQGNDVLGAGPVHGLGADEGVGVLGAPPVEVGTAGAPVATLPLPQDVGEVVVVVAVEVEPHRDLPADLGLPVQVALAPGHCGVVERAARRRRDGRGG